MYPLPGGRTDPHLAKQPWPWPGMQQVFANGPLVWGPPVTWRIWLGAIALALLAQTLFMFTAYQLTS